MAFVQVFGRGDSGSKRLLLADYSWNQDSCEAAVPREFSCGFFLVALRERRDTECFHSSPVVM